MQIRVHGERDDFSIPDSWLGLEAMEPFRLRIAELETEDISCQRELQKLDRELLATDSGDAASRRARLKRRMDALDHEKKVCEGQVARINDEARQRAGEFGMRLWRRREILKRIPDAPDIDASETVMRTYAIGQSEPDSLSKNQLRELLLADVRWIATWSADKQMIDEAARLSKEIADSKSYVVLRNSYVGLLSGEVVSEKRFQELACERGDIISRGARNAYPAGARVDRALAQSLGLT